MEKIDEAVRLRFIEHELRYRRWKLLAEIQVWEQSMARWREGCNDYRVTREANLALGYEAPSFADWFEWPPVRPWCLPAPHPRVEQHGAPCHEWCLGRQGDEEILAMIRAAKKHPLGGGWPEIPRQTRKKDAKDAEMGGRAGRAGGEKKSSQEQLALFGHSKPAPEADLQRYGVDAASMPPSSPSQIVI